MAASRSGVIGSLDVPDVSSESDMMQMDDRRDEQKQKTKRAERATDRPQLRSFDSACSRRVHKYCACSSDMCLEARACAAMWALMWACG